MALHQFEAHALEIAPTLLGAVLGVESEDGTVLLRITEVEAYHGIGTPGPHDESSHASRRKTLRNASMFGPPGHAYVYFTYGMHHALNVVCSPAGTPSAVLLRSAEVIDGDEIVRIRRQAKRRGTRPILDSQLASGPGNLATALALSRNEHDGRDLAASPFSLVLSERQAVFERGPRVGVVGSPDLPWRFWTPGPSVSTFRPGRGLSQ